MVSRKGFTMVELLVVLIILAILVAVAVPMYFSNTNRARASEAVAGASIVRQAIRDYKISHPSYAYPTIAASNALNAGIAAGFPTGVDVKVGVSRYFSGGAYSVDVGAALTTAPFGGTSRPNAMDFVITVDGGGVGNTACGTTGTPDNCAIKKADVDGVGTGIPRVIVKMDNSGTVYASYDGGTNWSEY